MAIYVRKPDGSYVEGKLWGYEAYIHIPVTTIPSEYAQYKIVIDSTNVSVYNAEGNLKTQGAVANNFWKNVKSDGSDIRVFNQNGQLYFWIEEWDYSNKKAVIWVKLEAGSSELNIAYGNPSATKSDYEDANQVFELFDDFEGFNIEPSGAWCWFQDPRAVYANGKTFFGTVNSNGDIVIYSYDHSSKVLNSYILHSALQVDDHVAPAILILPDGRLMVFYTKHNGNYLYYRVSKNPYDISSWDAEQSISMPEQITYPNPVYLSKEDRIYVFFRMGTYLNKWAYIYSDDGGNTWSNVITLFEYPTSETKHQYMKIISNGVDKIYFTHSGHPQMESNTSVYFFYYYNGSLYKADGTKIADVPTGLPISRADMDLVYDANASGISAWIWDIAIDENSYPVIVFATFPSTSDHRYNYARWNGTAWEIHEITSAGGYIDGSDQPYYSGGITIDKENPNTVYFSKQDPNTNQFEIYKGTTTDGGSTWSFEQLTSNSANKNVRPVAVRNHAEIKVLWMYGVYNAYTNYSTVIRNDWDGNFNVKWQVVKDTATVSNGIVVLSGTGASIRSLQTFDNAIIETKIKITSTEQYDHGIIAYRGDENLDISAGGEAGNGYTVWVQSNYYDQSLGLRKFVDGSITDIQLGTSKVDTTQWHTVRVAFSGDKHKVWLDDNLEIDATDTEFASGYIQIGNRRNGETHVDWVKVLKYADPADFGSPSIKKPKYLAFFF